MAGGWVKFAMRRVMITLLAAASLALSSVAYATTPIDEREWIEVRSDNFRIYSVLGEARSAELLRHLEVMRSSLGDSAEESTWRSSVPTVIFAVDNHDDYATIGAPANSAGFFFSDLRENAIIVDDSDIASGIQIVLHEYAHYLNKQSGRLRYPRWYEEGHAEYLSHSRLREQAFEYAMTPKQHVATLHFAQWLPYSQVLETSDTTLLEPVEGAVFYAQSWLLVHYLHSGDTNEQSIQGKMHAYADAVSGGQTHVQAFESVFDIDLEELEQELRRYHLNRRFESRQVPADTALPGFRTRVRELPRAEVQLMLAKMALRFENIDQAEVWFDAVLDNDDLRAHAEAGLGRVLGFRGDIEAANKRFDNAIHLMAWDFFIWMDYAQYWAQRVALAPDYKTRDRYASELFHALESALTINEATPELNSLMGYAHIAKGERDRIRKAIDYLEAAAEGAPHDQASRLLLANAYIFEGRFNEAEDVAESVLRFEHEPNAITDAAHQLLSDIQDLRKP
ncbi:MAG: tetratricopeptide repeat protein [Woeseiaceae bacterium]|nr:tetratricopeptide repeat protein [Woeseiaceae bacterium]